MKEEGEDFRGQLIRKITELIHSDTTPIIVLVDALGDLMRWTDKIRVNK